MKKLKLLIFTLITLIITPTLVNAASGTIKVTGTSTAVVNNKVTITVTLSSNSAIGSWDMILNYDKSFLQLTSSSADSGGNRMLGVTPSANGVKSKSYTFAFKALKKGTTNISVNSYEIYALDGSSMTMTTSSKSLKIMTQEELEATYSKDNNLKELSVDKYELDKEFNKDTLEYTVNVPTGTTSVAINAIVNDNTATVSGTGEIEVTEGLNTLPVVVTAQNGDQKTYTIIVNVEDQNPINVVLNNKKYIVVKNSILLEAPPTFVDTIITINEFEIPAFINRTANITLVGLKDTYGNIILSEYKNNEYSVFNEVSLNDLLLIPVSFDEELDLIKTTVTINDEKVDAYKYSENTDLVIINAQNLNDGKNSLYLYDPLTKTATRYDSTYIDEANNTIENYTYIILAFGGASILMLIIIFSLLHSLKKKQRKIRKFIEKQEAKMEKTRKLNDVVDEVKKITEKEKHEVRQDTTELKTEDKKKKKSKKKAEEEVTIKEIKNEKDLTNETKETKEIIKDKENIEAKESKKENNPSKEPNKEPEEEVYNLFEEDQKKKKKK